MISKNDVLGPVRSLVTDMDARYTPDAVAAAMDMAARAIVTYRPEANAKDAAFNVNANRSTHSLPADAVLLIDVLHTIENGAANTLRSPVRKGRRELFDTRCPEWRTPQKADTIEHYFYDKDAPHQVEFYPVCDQDMQVLIRYGAEPRRLPDGSTDLPNEYVNAMVHYTLYVLFSSDEVDAQNARIASSHLQQFYNVLGLKLKAAQRIEGA